MKKISKEEKEKLNYNEFSPIFFQHDTPSCPKCDGITFIDFNSTDYFECANPDCDFAFDGLADKLRIDLCIIEFEEE